MVSINGENWALNVWLYFRSFPGKLNIFEGEFGKVVTYSKIDDFPFPFSTERSSSRQVISSPLGCYSVEAYTRKARERREREGRERERND